MMMGERTDGVAEYLAAGIAENRAKKIRDEVKPELRQRVQLEGGLVVVAEEGVTEEYVTCPSCGPDRLSFETFETLCNMGLLQEAYMRTGSVRLEAPYGLEVGDMASPAGPRVDRTKIDQETLLWALENGALELRVNNGVLSKFDHEQAEEYLYHLPKLGAAITPAERLDVLRAASKKALNGEVK